MAKKKKKRDTDRNIFVYWDGEKERKGDPLEIIGRLDADKQFRPDRDVPLLFLDDQPEVQGEAGVLVADAVCRVFNVKPLEDGGLTIAERWQLLVNFYSFLSELKKKLPPLRTFPPSLEPTSSTSGEPTTNSTSDSI